MLCLMQTKIFLTNFLVILLTFLSSFILKKKKTGVSMMDPNHFLMIMLSRFELYQVFSTPDYGKRLSPEVTHKVRAWSSRPQRIIKETAALLLVFLVMLII